MVSLSNYGRSINPESVRERERRRALGVVPRRVGRDPRKRREACLRSERRRDAQGTEFIRSQKAHPRADCGVQYAPHVMQFDHVPTRGAKRFNIGTIRRHATRAALEAEIAKCDVVCVNCHAERTYRRRVA